MARRHHGGQPYAGSDALRAPHIFTLSPLFFIS